jgi:hypothetical protein
MGRAVAPMSARCHIKFRSDDVRRTVYRHWDGYPSAVIEDLLAFLAWSVRGSDVEYVAANFLYWSKRGTKQEQTGFGICKNDELHGDAELLLRRRVGVGPRPHHGANDRARRRIAAPRQGRGGGRYVARPGGGDSFRKFFRVRHSPTDDGRNVSIAEARLNGAWYFRDDRLREFRRCDNPHERITFDELRSAGFCGRSA